MKKALVLIMLLVSVISSASMKAKEQSSEKPIIELCCILEHEIE